MTFWEAPKSWRSPAALWWLGVGAVWLYAGFRILWPELGKPGETTAALLGLLAVLAFGRELRKSAALWLLLAAVVVQLLTWLLGYFHHPDWIPPNPQLDRLGKLFIFIGVAWWLGGSTRNTLVLWGLALVGYVIASFTLGQGLQEWLKGLQGERVGFGIRNKQHGAMLFGVALLGVVVFARRFILARGRVIGWRFSIWLAVLGICTMGVLIGQTRAVWLALLVALPMAGLLWLISSVSARSGQGQGRRYSRLVLGGLAIGFAMVAVIALVFQDKLATRITAESTVITQLLHGNVHDVPYTSIGIRVHSWVAASEWIVERPWVGWGDDGRSLVMDHTPWLPEHVKRDFGHLHNYLLEVWVAYGLLGLGVIAALAFWVGRGTWLAWRGGVLPGDMALFGAVFFAYWVIVNQFESYNSFWTGVYVHNLILGGLVTHYWRWQTMKQQTKQGF